MARLPIVDPDDPSTPATVAESMLAIPPYENPPNILKAMGNHPSVLQGFVAFLASLYGSEILTPAQRELSYTTATSVNECFY